MSNHSIATKIIGIILGVFLLTACTILLLAHFQLTKIIDYSQRTVYEEKINTILRSLDRQVERLNATEMRSTYEMAFQASALKTLRKTYYNSHDQQIYTFIINEKGAIILHPDLARGDKSLQNTSYVQKILQQKNGDFNYTYTTGETKWCIFREFQDWNWRVGYVVPLKNKYADARLFRNSLSLIMTIIIVIAIFALSVIIKKLIGPVNALTKIAKAIANGDLDQKIDTSGKDELGILSRSFADMRDKLKLRISELNNEISDRKQAEEALLTSEKRLKDLSENSTDWIWEFDENEIFTYSSPRIKDLLGYTPVEIIGQSAFDPIDSPESEKVKKEFLIFKNARKPFSSLVNNNHHKNGNIVILESSGVPIFDKNNKFRGYRGIDRDITERTNLEEQLRQAHKMEAIGTLAGGIAHDFNNILAAILGYADMAMDDIPNNHPAKENIEEVLKAGNRAKDLVQHILSFSRKEAQNRNPVQIHLIVNEALKLLRASIPTTIEIRKNIDSTSGTILANPTQIHQVVMNICTNAAQAMDEKGGRLEVDLSPIELKPDDFENEPNLKSGHYVHLSVRDNGTGVDQKDINRIFDPYFTTKEVGKGSGMGLAVVVGIVKSHDGIITVDSKPGEYTAFNVYLPRIQMQIQKEIEEDYPIPTGTETILVVDDEKSIVDMTKQRLERLGYKVTAKISSMETLELFRSQPDAFDLVITDQTMPELSGEELAEKLMAIRPNVPIIICTGYSSKIDKEKANYVGIGAFIMKPIDKKELAKTIRQVLDRRAIA